MNTKEELKTMKVRLSITRDITTTARVNDPPEFRLEATEVIEQR
jgi:hypothetical protein